MLSLHLPINSVSFGQVSTSIIRELVNRKEEFLLAPIGQTDLSSQKENQDLNLALQIAIRNFLSHHNRKSPIFKLWHLNGSMESFSDKQTLLSFYELDAPTREEVNIVNNNHKVLFTSRHTVDVFRSLGCSNVDFIPLGFDAANFSVTNKKYFNDDRITFSLTGKLEKRKNHAKIIRSWIKKYGNNHKYFLQCAIFNPFLKPEDNNNAINQIVEGKKYFNIQFLGFMHKNEIYNDFLNSSNIILGMSGGEGWGLPEFHSVALGKHAVIMNAHGYKGWANEKNSVLIDPNGKIPAVDGMFFRQGDTFNQGNIFDFDEDAFIDGCEKAIERVRQNKINKEGLLLQEDFSYSKTVDKLLTSLS
jgi:glycosyltransferase involved in cell wall biosynthesis